MMLVCNDCICCCQRDWNGMQCVCISSGTGFFQECCCDGYTIAALGYFDLQFGQFETNTSCSYTRRTLPHVASRYQQKYQYHFKSLLHERVHVFTLQEGLQTKIWKCIISAKTIKRKISLPPPMQTSFFNRTTCISGSTGFSLSAAIKIEKDKPWYLLPILLLPSSVTS